MDNNGVDFATTKQFDGPEGNQYNELTLLREQERADAIRRGLIDDPSKPKALEDAQIFIGTCQDMCPMYEREQREFQNDVKRWEINPSTGRIDKELAVKAFHRPAAGNEQALPSDVRPSDVLKRTLDYLVTKIVSNCDPLDKDTHGFVRDRTRSIRQDFTLQNERGLQAIDCHERIVRFHILSLHHMCEIDGFDAHQEMEQLRKTLQSLAEYYDDQQKNNVRCPNESEFRAYHILTRLRDPDVLRHVQTLRPDVRRSFSVLRALDLYRFAQRSNEEIGRFKPPNCEGSQNLYSRFFSLIRQESTTYIMACLCETQFNDIRKGALKSMRKSFISAVKAPSVDELVVLLGCDNSAEIENYCEQFSIVVRADEEGILRPILNKTSQFDESRPDLRQSFSHNLVESKRGSLSFAQVINGTDTASFFKIPEIESTGAQVTLSQKPFKKDANMDSAALIGDGSKHKSMSRSPVPPLLATTLTPSVITKSSIWEATKEAKTSGESLTIKSPEVHPVIQASPIEPKVDLNSILKNAASNVVSQLLQKHTKDIVEKSLAKVQRERRDKEVIYNKLLHGFAQDLKRGLVSDLLFGITLDCFADRWRATHCKKAAWRVILETSKRVQLKKRREAAQIEAKEIRDAQYADAFALLKDNQTARSRKRRRSLPVTVTETATKGTCMRATDVATRFWRPLEISALLSCFKNDISGRVLPSRWDVLLYTPSVSSPGTRWLEAKFAVDAQSDSSRSLQVGKTTVTIRTVHNVQTESCSYAGAVIFECSDDIDSSLDRTRLISLIQEIANSSDHKIVIMVLRFGHIEDELALSKALMIPDMLADRKTPIVDCKLVSIENMEDVGKFEQILETLVSDISLEISPLGMERRAKAEQEHRRTIAMPIHNETRPLKKLRNSFYDPGPMVPRAMHRPVLSSMPQRDQVPTQLAQLMQNLQSAKELLGKSVS